MRGSISRGRNVSKARIARPAAGGLFATAAVALLSSMAMPAKAQPDSGFFGYPETTLDGTVSANIAVPLERCREICTERSGCEGFDYSHEAGICRMFDAVIGAKANPARTAGARNMIPGYTPPSNPPANDTAAELLSRAWACVPASENANKLHLSWTVIFDRGSGKSDTETKFVDRRIQTVRNTDANSVTTLSLDTTFQVDWSKLGTVEVDRNLVTLQCANGVSCIRFLSSTGLSTDCRGFCGGQPWTAEAKKSRQRLRFCDADAASSAAAALRQLNPKVTVSTAPPQELRDPALVCWITDPSGTPLNVRNRPFGELTGEVLQNSQSIKVTQFSWDPRGHPWAAVPGGWSSAKYMTCQAPDPYE
ncbi:PAN domain-containing protein [Mesorhizobium sp. M1B.F.Ca.ET.045.04.1.1]|uniref:PAN domain-containing protein n=1 Tax=Mesorhizobium sp. M1B.F.Ca.ET.045.04.1.1 TaxID=2493673 RepID=UPI000F75CE2F|nr:PAN domain-containing protein [Mesorhizobium sp. M1B.F.Ca.ET.045.04.1.1]AZO32407.1 hypothetical protein EJ071_37075 [Mesorhizobium sp. M1B.F.Ca.ET.045.04.1.1]